MVGIIFSVKIFLSIKSTAFLYTNKRLFRMLDDSRHHTPAILNSDDAKILQVLTTHFDYE